MRDSIIREVAKAYTEMVESENRNLTEASVQGAGDLAKKIEELYHKYFPNSWISAKLSKNISASISVEMALAKDKSEATSKIIDNDPAHAMFMVWLKGALDDSDNITGTIVAERSVGGGLSWFPAGGGDIQKVKIPFRKTTGDADKVLKAFDRYFKRLRDAVKDNADSLNAKLDFDVTKKVK